MLPFRFKAGGSGPVSGMATTAQPMHHHRSTTKVDHKPFKSKHSTKSQIRDAAKGKVEREDRVKRRTPHQQVMSKLARKNQAKQLRMNHKEKQDHEENIFNGLDGAAKHIAVVPLSKDVNIRQAIRDLCSGLDMDVKPEEVGPTRIRVDRFKRNLLYMPATTDLLNAIDVCKMADWVVFVLKADQEISEEQDVLLRAIEGQGITSVAVVVQDLNQTIPANKRSRHLADMKLGANHYFPGIEKVSALDNKSDCANLVRTLCTASMRGIRWRDSRSWMLVENCKWLASTDAADTANVVLTGTLRGKGLQPNRLVHVPGWGEYQIHRITQIPKANKRKADEMVVEANVNQWVPSSEQDDLAELAPEQVEMKDVTSDNGKQEQKGVLLDDHHYFSDDNSHIPETPKRLPNGTSNYQSAWFLEDVSDSDSDMIDDDEEMQEVPAEDPNVGPEDGAFVAGNDAMTDVPNTEYPESEMHVDADDEEEARQLREFRESRKKEAEEDLEFPDEIELHPDVLARERLAKYRGLKSLRTSEWNTAEDAPYEPEEYKRLLQIPDYKKSYSAALKESLAGGVPAGSKVDIELRQVPVSLQTHPTPSTMFSLLRHEHKQTVININLMLYSDLEQPIKAKEELIVQIGHRRLAINPIFSASGQTPNDVHKSDRFLHPGRSTVATFTGPLTWGSVPILVFRRKAEDQVSGDVIPQLANSGTKATIASSDLELIGSATTLPPSSTRVIAKRVILTGHPYKINKKLVTIRYMFFNREDVEWFKALPLWTKRGRQGWIKEPLGTHGYFKATFDGAGKINNMDAIGVSLYKRVWPRASTQIE